MKHLIMAMLLFAVATITFAQKQNAFKKIYVEGGGGPAGHNGGVGDIGLSSVLKSDWTISVSYFDFAMDPKNLPENYKQAITLLYVIPVPEAMPEANMNMVNISAGRFFGLSRKIWATAELGFSIVKGDEFTFAPQPETNDGIHISSNYSVQKKSVSGFGGLIRTDLNWAFCPYAGLGLGLFATMNSIQSPAGGELKLLVGWLNTKKKSSN